MARHNDTGKLGELLARNWAVEKGYVIRALNWRYGNWEIDMIAVKGKKLHFFEVKTRRSAAFGHPEALVGKIKMRNFISAGAAYIRRYPTYKWIQFNILSITLDSKNTPTFFLIEDVYC